jgi:hypothetical protein
MMTRVLVIDMVSELLFRRRAFAWELTPTLAMIEPSYAGRRHLAYLRGTGDLSRFGEMPMGAWGRGSFDNDDAADWVYEFERDGVAAVASALQHAAGLSEGDYLEAPEAAQAIAAAEIVAAARDGDLSRLSAPARDAFPGRQQAVAGANLSELAEQTVERVLRRSELKDLWDEADDGEAWSQDIADLLARLT